MGQSNENGVEEESSAVSSRFHIPIPCINLIEYLFDSTAQNEYWTPKAPILLSADDPDFPGYTHDQLKSLTKAFGCGLLKQGGKGQKAIIYGRWNHHVPIALLGCLGVGTICYLMSPLDTADAVGRFELLSPDYVFVAPESKQRLENILSIVECPPKRVYVIDDCLETGSDQPRNKNTLSQHWSSLLDIHHGPEFSWPQVSDEFLRTAPALILNTSGTTGSAKLAERTHYGFIGNTEQLLYRYNLKPRAKETFFNTFVHSGIGFIIYGLLMPLRAKYATIIIGQFSLDKYVYAVERHRPTALHSPKHILQQLLDHTSGADFSSVMSMRTGGAHIHYSMCERWQRLHGSVCEVVCGMTEGGIHFASDPLTPETDETVGELLPNLIAKVVDDTGKIQARNKMGEIWIKNPFAMKKYWNNPKETKAAFSSDDWIKTGDLGRVNGNNRWYICGRKKDLFKIHGRHVSAAQIESAIMQHVDVADVVVVAVVLPGHDELFPHAYLVRKKISTLTYTSFLEWMRTELPPELHVLANVQFLDVLPLSMAGKVDRNMLRANANKAIHIQKGMSMVGNYFPRVCQ